MPGIQDMAKNVVKLHLMLHGECDCPVCLAARELCMVLHRRACCDEFPPRKCSVCTGWVTPASATPGGKDAP
jgi:hypothetical protein